MEIDTFTQCLNYLELAHAKKQPLELIIPVVSSLLGVLVGASLTMLREGSKDKKALKNKKMCITEELDRTQLYLEHIFEEAIQIYDSSVAGNIVPGHQLQAEVSLPFLLEHFTSIAHKYSQDERNHITRLSETTKELNQQLKEFHSLREPLNFQKNALISLNIISATIHCHQILQLINSIEIKQKKLALVALSDKLEINSPYIETLRISLGSPTDNP
ncbi:hypothetical protein [Pseudomonas sp.]|uniref:hypothetical protein n=1 Tax=Pseudomonas sp. TaxID=306 RepID=UPI0032633439